MEGILQVRRSHKKSKGSAEKITAEPYLLL